MLKTKKKAILIVIVLLLALGFTAVYLHFYRKVNKKFKEPPVFTYTFGQRIPLDSRTYIKVDSFQSMDMAELRQLAPDYKTMARDQYGEALSDDKIKAFLVHATIVGVYNSDMDGMLHHMELVSGTDYSTMDPDLLKLLNPDFGEANRAYSQTVTLPYLYFNMNYNYKCVYNKKDWEALGSRKYDLVLYTRSAKYITGLS